MVAEEGAYIFLLLLVLSPFGFAVYTFLSFGGLLTFLQIIEGSGIVFHLTDHALHDLLSRRLLALTVYLYVLLVSVRRGGVCVLFLLFC
jgi:hypothetical protein